MTKTTKKTKTKAPGKAAQITTELGHQTSPSESKSFDERFADPNDSIHAEVEAMYREMRLREAEEVR